ncbi:MAG: hypothetical protein ACRERD_09455 [Candidatus Binatia bacterium]
MSNEKSQSSVAAADLPDLLAILTPFFDQSAPQEHRILLAVLERLAAEHYRRWAGEVSDPSLKQGLLQAARREEEIAETIESLDPHAQSIAQSLIARFPNARATYADLLKGKSLAEQWQMQSIGERGGGRILRDFAAAESDPGAREKILACAVKDEENSRFLEEVLKDL